jgi:hypothetical protein
VAPVKTATPAKKPVEEDSDSEEEEDKMVTHYEITFLI